MPANLLDTGVVGPTGRTRWPCRSRWTPRWPCRGARSWPRSWTALVGRPTGCGWPTTRPGELWTCREAVTEELSTLYREAQRSEFGSALVFADRQAHLQSVREVCVETGAKGSEKKLSDYARNLGDDQGVPGITQADQEASMFATAIKAHGTGLGGSFSQRAVRALRGDDLQAVLEVTYPVTQSILQAKHDAAEARHKYAMLHGPGRDLWRGRRLRAHGPEPVATRARRRRVGPGDGRGVGEAVHRVLRVQGGLRRHGQPRLRVAACARALEDPRTGLIRNLEEDPSLRGTVMDRMAYGGDFDSLLQAAKDRESVFDGAKSEQFASAATRRARAQTAKALEPWT